MYYAMLTFLPLFQQTLMQLFMVGLGVFVVWNFSRDASGNKGIKYSLLTLCYIGILGDIGNFSLQMLLLVSGSAMIQNANSEEYSLSKVIFMYMSTLLMPSVIAVLAYMRFRK